MDRHVRGAGELIYTGKVVPVGTSAPAFRYERWVARTDNVRVATHLTYPVGPACDPVLSQRATHTPEYDLLRFEESDEQVGGVGSLDIQHDGSLFFTLRRGSRVRTKTEPAGAPVVVGPTLFGYARAHLDKLRAGASIDVRFAVLSEARTYAFTLRATRILDECTTLEMAASSFFLRLVVDSMRFEFDHRKNQISTYQGRVPPRRNGRPFDAHVHYEYAATAYR